ncbi:tetratricopeptide repeat protein [Sphingomonas bacterium]|uniref:tetratricopeptide repeat protein n=1 Tax=Sphingomonas bacterium TaxID=1895847 RepID=UPI00262600F6|nr:tetratricopeptide repeat protein [Sphingomonas bacterium]
MKVRNYLGFSAALIASSAAVATDRNGYRAIAAGDFRTAVQRLEAERRIHPQRPELMLNLAAAYRRTGRSADARALYHLVLRRPVVMLDLPSGDVASSRDLANTGLARITEFASR